MLTAMRTVQLAALRATLRRALDASHLLTPGMTVRSFAPGPQESTTRRCRRLSLRGSPFSRISTSYNRASLPN
jgi:hypothetical protein